MNIYIGTLVGSSDPKNKTRLSQEALDDILAKQPAVPVRINFAGDPIGSVSKYWSEEDGSIQCEIEVKYPSLDELNLFLVLGGEANIKDIHQDESGYTIIEKIELTEVSITPLPATPEASKIEKIFIKMKTASKIERGI